MAKPFRSLSKSGGVLQLKLTFALLDGFSHLEGGHQACCQYTNMFREPVKHLQHFCFKFWLPAASRSKPFILLIFGVAAW